MILFLWCQFFSLALQVFQLISSPFVCGDCHWQFWACLFNLFPLLCCDKLLQIFICITCRLTSNSCIGLYKTKSKHEIRIQRKTNIHVIFFYKQPSWLGVRPQIWPKTLSNFLKNMICHQCWVLKWKCSL